MLLLMLLSSYCMSQRMIFCASIALVEVARHVCRISEIAIMALLRERRTSLPYIVCRISVIAALSTFVIATFSHKVVYSADNNLALLR